MVKVKEDLTGRRFGKLVVVEQAEDYVSPKGQHQAQWHCKCDCGTLIDALGQHLLSDKKTSCGCDTLLRKRDTYFKKLKKELHDSIGKQFGHLTIIDVLTDIDDLLPYRQIKIRCQCSCGCMITTNWAAIKDGKCTHCGCLYRELVYGVGCFDGIRGENNEQIYRTWLWMLRRCYDEKTHERQPAYQSCTVCNEWLLFSNFQKWYLSNEWYDGQERIHIDKDMLVKGNKTYSPDTCVIIPQSLNCILTKSDAARGNCPIGVSYHKKRHVYMARVGINATTKYLGDFNSADEAFEVYKKAKEQYIKQVADEYKAEYPEFPQKLYDAMYAYEVEITD